MKFKNYLNKTYPRNIMVILFLITLLVFTGCKVFAPIFTEIDSGNLKYERPNVFAVFMDGTNNKFNSRIQNKNSNVKRMYDLKRPEFSSIYIEGVGTNKKAAGLILGIGTKARVVKAYTYLTERYTSSNDSIYLFGFSRGAYSCRILSNLIYTAGILDQETV